MIGSCEDAFHRTSFLSTLLVTTFFLLLFSLFRHHVFNDVRSRGFVLLWFGFAIASEGERQAKTFLLQLKALCLARTVRRAQGLPWLHLTSFGFSKGRRCRKGANWPENASLTSHV